MAHLATITIDSTQVGADLTDFPIYVDLSDLPSSFWGTVANGGGDIRVFLSDDSTELPREVVSCDTATETGELHFLLDYLSSSSDTDIHIYADGTSSDYATTDTYGRNAVWDDYSVVLHMQEEGLNLTYTDSTGNGRDTTRHGASFSTETGRPLGGSWPSFNTTNYLSIDNTDDTFIGASGVTMQCIVNSDVVSTAKGILGNRYQTDDNHWLQINSSAKFFAKQTSTVATYTGTEYTGTNYWYAMLIDSSTMEGMQNGTLVGSDTSTSSFPNATGSYGDTRIATYYTAASTYSYDGNVAEVRVRLEKLAQTWISTEYSNQNDPATFYSVTDPSVVSYDFTATSATLSLTSNDSTVTYTPATEVTTDTDSLTITANDSTVTYDPVLEVTTTADTLTLSENDSTVTYDPVLAVETTTDTLTLTENDVTTDFQLTVTSDTDSLTLTENQSTISFESGVVTDTDSLTITANDTTVTLQANVDVTTTTDSLFITENNSTVTQIVTADATTETLSLTSNDTTIATSLTVSATSDTLTITENAASTSSQTNISGTAESLTLTSNDTTVDTTLTVAGTTDTLTVTENDHNVTVGSTILTTTETLSLSENNASLNTVLEVNATTDSLTILENDTTVTIGGTVSGTTDSLLLMSNDVTMDFALEVTTDTDSLSLTENDVTVTQGLQVTSSTDSLSLTENDTTADFVLTVEGTTDSLTTTDNDANVSTSAVITTTLDTLSTSANDETLDFVLTVSGTTQDLTTDTNEAEAFMTNGQYILCLTSTSSTTPMIAVFARPGDRMYVFRHVQDDGTEEIINTGIVASGTDTLSIDVTSDNPVLYIDGAIAATSSLSYAATSVIFHGVGALIQSSVTSHMTGRIWDIYATDPNSSTINRYYEVSEGEGSSVTDSLDGDVATISGFDASMWS